MKEKQMACFILVLLIAGMGYGTYYLRQKKQEAQSAAEQAQRQAQSAEDERVQAETSLNNLKRESEGLRGFYRQWLPHFEAVQNVQAGESIVIDAIRSGSVFSLSQRFEEEKGKKDTVIPQIVQAHVVFEDDYSKTVNWIGEIERSLPSARTSRCVITPGDTGNDVHVELTLEIPVFDPREVKAETPEAKPDKQS